MSNVYYAQPTCLRIHGPLMAEIHDATISTLINPFTRQWDLTLLSSAFSSTNVDLIQKIPLSMRLDCVSGAAFVFSFFFFSFFIEKCISSGILSVNGSCLLCTGPTTSLTSKIFTGMCLSMGPVQHYSFTHKSLFSTKLSLKMGPIILFTYLKIILLQCF